jgi:hypothetical protein
MTYKEFYDKLNKFFTDRQIMTLSNYGRQAARDAMKPEWIPYERLTYEGHDFVCNLLWDYMGDMPDVCRREIEQIAGGFFSEESRIALGEQMNEEW